MKKLRKAFFITQITSCSSYQVLLCSYSLEVTVSSIMGYATCFILS